ncbi:hypothetical protein, partial [Citrobacter youngae]|uniref:hypothetical protein n=1 Tax=Citrobacter youngae TaxID=133448 RepID=UPI001953B164
RFRGSIALAMGSGIGTIVLLNIFGASTLTKLVTKNSPFMLTRFIKESLVQLVLLCYLFVLE